MVYSNLRCITDMIAAGQLGYPFVVADLVGGGVCGNNGNGIIGIDFRDELFIRHLQIECLSPMVQFRANSTYGGDTLGAPAVFRSTEVSVGRGWDMQTKFPRDFLGDFLGDFLVDFRGDFRH